MFQSFQSPAFSTFASIQYIYLDVRVMQQYAKTNIKTVVVCSSSVVGKAHAVNFSNKDEKTILCYILTILISLRYMEDCGVHYVHHGQYLILICCKLFIIFRLILTAGGILISLVTRL